VSAPDELRTERLVLRRPVDSDLPDLVAMHDDMRMMKTLGGRQDAEQTRAGLEAMLAYWEQHGFGHYIVTERGTGRFLGRCVLRRMVIDGAEEPEIGWSIVADEWGRGYATEAARAIMRVAFDTLGFESLVAVTLPFNDRSRRVMEKLGFAYEKDCWHAELPHVLYRLHGSAAEPD